MSALRRWWGWETRMFRRDGKARAGERTGLLIGLGIMLIGVVVTVLPLATR